MRSTLKSTEQLPECPAWLAESAERVVNYGPPRGERHDPGGVVDRRVRAMQVADPKLDYADAMTKVLAADPALKEAYAGSDLSPGAANFAVAAPAVRTRWPESRPARDVAEAGEEVDRRARRHMAEAGETDYGAAVRAVLAADAPLARVYCAVAS